MPTFSPREELMGAGYSEDDVDEIEAEEADLVPVLEQTSVLPDLPGVLHLRPCLVTDCDVVVQVRDTGIDTLGIGMSVEAATDLDARVTEHIYSHPAGEWFTTVQLLTEQLDQAKVAAVAPVRALGQTFVPHAVDVALEQELDESRAAQDRFDPLKATPTYKPDLPEGTVGVRR